MKEFIWPDKPNPTAFPVARPGLPIILGCAFTTAVLALLGFAFLTNLALGQFNPGYRGQPVLLPA